MSMIDPTYLRTIHDGLLLGKLHKDNASALPMGLVGMYEEALPPASNVNERKKFLEFLAVWALLKKEVSVAFLIPLLQGWSEETIIYYINKYSKWFNSPQSGKYVLYHERLRAFILQKISKTHFNACNGNIIKISHDALSGRSGDEWERYALEYLSNHMLIPAIEKGDASVLKLLAYNTTHWNRQVEISKGFEWSKRMLNNMMLWASKYDNEEVIECALNKVDLHHQEQNDAPRIVELVAQNDIETALQRIEAFGGNDKEGLQRKFILYMLCLMELTLLDSKDKPFRKDAIEKLLKHLNDNIPANQPDLINWNDFFPSYLMFQMACEWEVLDLEYLVAYKFTDNGLLDKEWIKEKRSFNELQFQVLLECSLSITDNLAKSNVLKVICSKMANQGKIDNALKCSLDITDESAKSSALKEISNEMAKQGKFDDALNCTSAISDGSGYKSSALKNIAIELVKNGKVDKALECLWGIVDDKDKSIALAAIATELSKQNKIEQAGLVMQKAHECALSIVSELNKTIALAQISTELARQGNMQESAAVIQQSIECALSISFEARRSLALKSVATEFTKQGKIDLALECARGISFQDLKNVTLNDIATELVKQDEIETALYVMQEALESHLGKGSKSAKINALKDMSIKLAKKGKIDQSLEYAFRIRDEFWKNPALAAIATELAKQGKIAKALEYAQGISFKDVKIKTLIAIAKQVKTEEVASVMHQLIKCASVISDQSYKGYILRSIVAELANQGNLSEAVQCSLGILDESERSLALKDVASELNKHGKFEEAALLMQESLKSARVISDESNRSLALKDIASELTKQKKVEEAVYVIQEALECAREISYVRLRVPMLMGVATELTKQGKIEEATSVIQEALEFSRGISYKSDKRSALKDIINELTKQGKISEALKYTQEISDEYDKSSALKKITIELAKQGKMKEALEFSRGISYESDKSIALVAIAAELAKDGNIEEAASVMEKALECARGMSFEPVKIRALMAIAIEFSRQGKIDQALACTSEISDESEKENTLGSIASFLAKQRRIDKSLECARSIISEHAKSGALKNISIELSEQGNWLLAEKTGLEIPQTLERYKCWEDIAKARVREKGALESFIIKGKFQNNEAKKYYLKGWVEDLPTLDCNADLILSTRHKLIQDIGSLYVLLQKHALHELFFNKASQDKIYHFNRVLNIQWAIDIKNSISASKS